MDLGFIKNLRNRFSSASKGSLALTARSGTDSQAQIHSALAQFASARHGKRCQTRSFALITGDTEWHSGQQDPLSGTWNIRKNIECENVSGAAARVGEPSIKTKTLQVNISFYDAIEALSLYERGQLANGMIALNESEDIGAEHYIAFAENEGIVFDTDGEPHPTLDGEIITDGTFTKAAVERAKAYSKKHSARYAPGGADGILPLLIKPSALIGSYTETMEKTADLSSLIQLQETLETLSALMTSTFIHAPMKDKTLNLLTLNTTTLYEPVDYPDTDKHKTDNYKLLHSIVLTMKSVGAFNLQDAFEKIIERAHGHANALDQFKEGPWQKSIQALEIYYKLHAARYVISTNRLSAHPFRRELTLAMKDVEECEQKFLQLGGKKDDVWRVKSMILDPNPPSIENTFKPLINSLKDMTTQQQQELQKLKTIAASGPYLGQG